MVSLFNIIYCKYCSLLVLFVNLRVIIWILTVYLTFYRALRRIKFFILMIIFNVSRKIEFSFLTKYRYFLYCFFLNFDSRELLIVFTFCTVMVTYLYSNCVYAHYFKYIIQTFNYVIISDWLNYCIFSNDVTNLIIIVFCDHLIIFYVQYPYLGYYLLFVASLKGGLFVGLFMFFIMGGINIRCAKISMFEGLEIKLLQRSSRQ